MTKKSKIMSSLKQINLFDILPGTFIQTVLATKTRYENLEELYNLCFEVRYSLLDLLRIKKISLRYGLVFSSGNGEGGTLGDGNTNDHDIGTPSSIDYTNIGKRKVVQVAAGYDHSLFLCEDGSVFSCGDGFGGKLGDGDTSDHEVGTPSPINTTNIGERKVVQVAASSYHSLFLCEDGSVFSSGEGLFGTLGDGNTTYHPVATPSPIDITNIGERKVVQVAASSYHSLFLCEDGSVFSSGVGENGRLGDGNTSNHKVGTPSPIDISLIGNRKVVQVAASKTQSIFLCEDGSVFSSGNGGYGNLGDDNTGVHEVGTPSPIDTTNIGERKVVQVAAGIIHSLFLCEDGSVFSCGNGQDGRLGDGNTSNHKVGTPSPIDTTNIGERKVVQVAAGPNHSLFLCEDGSVFSSGDGDFGKLGNGKTSDHSVGTPSPIDSSLIGDRKVVQVAAGISHSLFLT